MNHFGVSSIVVARSNDEISPPLSAGYGNLEPRKSFQEYMRSSDIWHCQCAAHKQAAEAYEKGFKVCTEEVDLLRSFLLLSDTNQQERLSMPSSLDMSCLHLVFVLGFSDEGP